MATRDELGQQLYGKTYDQLTPDQKRAIDSNPALTIDAPQDGGGTDGGGGSDWWSGFLGQGGQTNSALQQVVSYTYALLDRGEFGRKDSPEAQRAAETIIARLRTDPRLSLANDPEDAMAYADSLTGGWKPGPGGKGGAPLAPDAFKVIVGEATGGTPRGIQRPEDVLKETVDQIAAVYHLDYTERAKVESEIRSATMRGTDDQRYAALDEFQTNGGMSRAIGNALLPDAIKQFDEGWKVFKQRVEDASIGATGWSKAQWLALAATLESQKGDQNSGLMGKYLDEYFGNLSKVASMAFSEAERAAEFAELTPTDARQAASMALMREATAMDLVRRSTAVTFLQRELPATFQTSVRGLAPDEIADAALSGGLANLGGLLAGIGASINARASARDELDGYIKRLDALVKEEEDPYKEQMYREMRDAIITDMDSLAQLYETQGALTGITPQTFFEGVLPALFQGSVRDPRMAASLTGGSATQVINGVSGIETPYTQEKAAAAAAAATVATTQSLAQQAVDTVIQGLRRVTTANGYDDDQVARAQAQIDALVKARASIISGATDEASTQAAIRNALGGADVSSEGARGDLPANLKTTLDTTLGLGEKGRAGVALGALAREAAAAGLDPSSLSDDPYVAFNQVLMARSRKDPNALQYLLENLGAQPGLARDGATNPLTITAAQFSALDPGEQAAVMQRRTEAGLLAPGVSAPGPKPPPATVTEAQAAATAGQAAIDASRNAAKVRLAMENPGENILDDDPRLPQPLSGVVPDKTTGLVPGEPGQPSVTPTGVKIDPITGKPIAQAAPVAGTSARAGQESFDVLTGPPGSGGRVPDVLRAGERGPAPRQDVIRPPQPGDTARLEPDQPGVTPTGVKVDPVTGKRKKKQ